MGYACPVCHAPQADGEHLANHLAFSALLGHDDHAAWLDEHVDGWNDDGPEELAERVTPHADAVEYPEVFEDTTEGAAPDVSEELLRSGERATPAEPGPDAQQVIEEARELTRRRRETAPDPDDAPAGEGASDSTDASERADASEGADGTGETDEDESGK